MPLTLTIISTAVPKEKQAEAIGIWGAFAGLAVALGPVVGGAIVDGISWHWVFWLNVPVGIVLVPILLRRLDESHGGISSSFDLKGVALGSAGLFGLVWGVVRSQEIGWTGPEVVVALTAGAVGVALFRLREWTTAEPMLPLRLFRDRTFATANVATFLMYVGLFWAPSASVVLSAAREEEQGVASGANNSIRELGGRVRRGDPDVDLLRPRWVRIAGRVRRRVEACDVRGRRARRDRRGRCVRPSAPAE